MASPGTLVTKNNFHIGAWCSRSRMWCWGDQDNYKPMKIVRIIQGDAEDATWVEVEVQKSGGMEKDKFRMGAEGAFDLVYGTNSERQDTAIDPPSHLVGKPVTPANFIERARVSRGSDWKWGDQDKGGSGILLRRKTMPTGEFAFARWGPPSDSVVSRDHIYRIGAQGAHDLVYGTRAVDLAVISAPSHLLGKPVTKSNFIRGAQVTRGKEWTFEFQDVGKPGILLRIAPVGATGAEMEVQDVDNDDQPYSAWVRWADNTENCYSTTKEHLVYGTVSAVPIELPVFKGRFTLEDRFRVIDADEQTGEVICRGDQNCSVFTKQMFDIGKSEFEVFFKIVNLKDGIGCLGIFKDDPTSLSVACRHIVGEVELKDSIGLGISANGQAVIVSNDKKSDHKKVNTDGSTIIGMKLTKGGNISFSIDGQPFNIDSSSDTYRKLRGLSGVYRVCVSFDKTDQKGHFSTKSEDGVSPAEDGASSAGTIQPHPSLENTNKPINIDVSRIPNDSYSGSFTFWDSIRGVDVVDNGKELICRTTKRQTVLSRQVFNISSTSIEQSFFVPGGVFAGDICIGLAPENPGNQSHEFLCGEKEIPNSVSLILRPEQMAILHDDKIRDGERWNTQCDTKVVMRIQNGKLSYEVDGNAFSAPYLDQTAWPEVTGSSRSRFRIAISLACRGQRVTLNPDNAKIAGSLTPAYPYNVWRPEMPFTFFDMLKSIDVVGNKREIVGVADCRATVFSRQIFNPLTANFSETVTFQGGLQGGDVAVGIVNFIPGDGCLQVLCGEVEIPDSISLILRGSNNHAAILHRDKMADAEIIAGVNTAAETKVKIELKDKMLTFYVNGKKFQSPYIQRNIGEILVTKEPPKYGIETCFRLAISLSKKGQKAVVVLSDAPRDDWISGTPFILHDFIPSISVINNGAEAICLKSHTRGTSVFSKQIFESSTANFTVTLKVQGGTKRGNISFGVCDEDVSAAACSDHMIGEKELINSIGFILLTKNTPRAAVLHRDNIEDAEEVSGVLDQDVTITLVLRSGKLSFLLNNKPFSSPHLNNITMNGKFRLGLSLSEEGQRVSINTNGAAPPKPSPVPQPQLHQPYTGGGGGNAAATTTNGPSKNISPQSQQEAANETIYGETPVPLCFNRGVPKLSLNDAVAALFSLKEVPRNRPDLQEWIPSDVELNAVLSYVNNNFHNVKNRPAVKKLVQFNRLTDEDIKILFLYKIEHPYPVYRWLNGWLMSNRRDGEVKEKVGPLFTLLYRAMEKLPKVCAPASRAVIVNNIPSLTDTFENHKSKLAPNETFVSFWGFASFSTDDEVINNSMFIGEHAQNAIVYSCGNLIGVDMDPFAPTGMNESEILPLCPCVFQVQMAVKVGTKLTIGVRQLEHSDYAYVLPSANAAPSPVVANPLAPSQQQTQQQQQQSGGAQKGICGDCVVQ